jgi:hypothetical protein
MSDEVIKEVKLVTNLRGIKRSIETLKRDAEGSLKTLEKLWMDIGHIGDDDA